MLRLLMAPHGTLLLYYNLMQLDGILMVMNLQVLKTEQLHRLDLEEKALA
jgi:hypothetical protein